MERIRIFWKSAEEWLDKAGVRWGEGPGSCWDEKEGNLREEIMFTLA